MKKLFGGINLSWTKLIVMALLAAVYGAAVCIIPGLKETSFHNSSVSFEIWILFGIFIIMNSKSNIDSALKCFVFFLISQPLIYIIQDIINGSSLVSSYYGYWFIWTIACLPMGYIGYYMKKDKCWSFIILTPMLFLLYFHFHTYLAELVYTFPYNTITVIFCAGTMILYPLVLFKNKYSKYIGLSISLVLVVIGLALSFSAPHTYDPILFCNSDEHPVNESYKANIVGESKDSVNVEYVTTNGLNDWCVVGHFKMSGDSQFEVIDSDGNKKTYKITVLKDKYDYEEIK